MQPTPAAAAATVYRERLAPGPSYVAGAVGLGVMLGLVVWFVSVGWAVGLGGVLAIVLALALWFSSPVVSVERTAADGPVLRAGRAWIPLDQLAHPVVLDAAALREALGPGSDARSYGCIRPWLRAAVRVEVTDLDDPTPYWIVATRHPDALAAALRAGGTPD